jgi:6-phosphogluconate dehydrogenase
MNKEIAFIGLGRMGAAMAARLNEKGYDVHGYDANEDARTEAAKEGIQVHESLEETILALTEPRVIWMMVPSKYVDDVLKQLTPLLAPDDTIIDGGNSFFKDTVTRHHHLVAQKIHYIDCGTSGGVEGARTGASLMVGGTKSTVKRFEHIFKDMALENGYGHVGETGAGHFVKMVHNGIEYGMMGAIAEGINVLHEHKDGLAINITEALEPYQHGSIITSNLMNWLADAYKTEGYLEKIAGEVPTGETEMEMQYLINHENVRVLDAALQQRKLTRLEPSFIGTLISAMRNQFGGHQTIKKPDIN